MLTATSEKKTNCYAWTTGREEGPFFCKLCGRESIIKKGKIIAHHFAHKAKAKDCTFGVGESDIHHRAKREIFEDLCSHSDCVDCDVELPINNVIPDVYAVIRGAKVAIEVQKSKMTVDEAYRRTVELSKNGCM